MQGRSCVLFSLIPALASMGCEREPAPGGIVESRAASRPAAEGRWLEAARAQAAEALRLGPDGAGDLVQGAMASYVQASRLEEAERFAADWLARFPREHDVLYYLGESQRVLKDHEAARVTLQRLLSLAPQHVEGKLALGLVLGALGEHESAWRYLDEYLASPRASGEQRLHALVPAARSLRRLGRPQAAADRLAEVLEADPFHGAALAEATQAFLALGKHELAKGLRAHHQWLAKRGHFLSTGDESMEFATGPAPDAGGSQALRLADRRELLAATRDLTSEVEKRPADTVLRVVLGRLWLRLHRAGDSLQALAAAAGDRDVGPDALGVRAAALELLGRLAESRRAWQEASRALQAGHGSALELDRVVEIHWRAGCSGLDSPEDHALAEQSFLALGRVAPGDWRHPCGLARLALSRGDPASAGALIETAWQRAGDDAASAPTELRRTTAVVKGVQGDLKTAARMLMQLVKAHPGEPESYRAFARVFEAQGNVPEVAQVLAMKERLESQLASRQRAIEAFSSAPLAASAPAALALARELLATGEREAALDLLFLAAELDPSLLDASRTAAAVLKTPRETFLRLRTLRRLLDAAPDDTDALLTAAQVYADLGVRLNEALRLAMRHEALRPGGDGALLRQAIQARR